MTVTDNYRGLISKPGGDRVGFAEIQFDATATPSFQASATRARPTATQNASNPSTMHDGSSGTQWYSVASGSDYFGTGGTPPVLVIDLGSQQTIDSFDFSNYTVVGNRLKEFSLRFATEDEGPGAAGGSIGYQPGFTVANQGPSVNQSFAFSQPVSARYVEMTLTDNYAEAGSGGDRVGFAEIQFSQVKKLSHTDVFKPIAATSSTSSSDYFPVANLIDGNPDTTWVTSSEGDYFSNRHAPILTFDMGNDLPLSGLIFQNYGTWGNGTKDIALSFATEVEGPGGFGNSISYFPIFSPLANNALTQEFSFDQVVNARYVQMLVLDNYAGWGFAGGDRVGFAEISFLAVPEPTTVLIWSLLAGLGVGLRWRRRK
jgi:hypothetical protein